jgi:thiol-disulfide isomerase/thioredoxin
VRTLLNSPVFFFGESLNNKTLITLSTVFAVLVLLFHLSAKKQPSDDETNMFEAVSRPLQWQGRRAPDFAVDLLNGQKFTLSEEVGKKVIVLNFFATWCGPCKEEMLELVRYFEKHKGEPFLMIGIDADETESAVRDFAHENGVTYPVSIDRGKLQRAFSVRAFPTTVFIGADGVVKIYEIGQIRNADVAFDPLLATGLEAVRAGTGITKEAFLAKQEQKGSEAQAAEEGSPEEKKAEGPQLAGRAGAIAEKMNCPCGCAHTVMECTCKTAKDIKEQLAKRDWSAMSDEEVMKTLNREFCMK